MSEKKYPLVEQLDGRWYVVWDSGWRVPRTVMPDERTARMCAAATEAFALLEAGYMERITIEWYKKRKALLASVQGEKGEGE